MNRHHVAHWILERILRPVFLVLVGVLIGANLGGPQRVAGLIIASPIDEVNSIASAETDMTGHWHPSDPTLRCAADPLCVPALVGMLRDPTWALGAFLRLRTARPEALWAWCASRIADDKPHKVPLCDVLECNHSTDQAWLDCSGPRLDEWVRMFSTADGGEP